MYYTSLQATGNDGSNIKINLMSVNNTANNIFNYIIDNNNIIIEYKCIYFILSIY